MRSLNIFSVSALALCALFALKSPLGFARDAALVVIDMQPFFSERGNNHNRPENQAKIDQILQRQVELIQSAKDRDVPIVMIEYKACGPTCGVLTQAIGNYVNTRTFVKATDGMFNSFSGIVSDLKTYLADRNVTELIVTGANGGACVKCSIEGALNEGYRVWTDPHAIADFNSADFTYPYSYGDGQLSVQPDLKKKLNQRPNMKTFDEILADPSKANSCRNAFDSFAP